MVPASYHASHNFARSQLTVRRDEYLRQYLV